MIDELSSAIIGTPRPTMTKPPPINLVLTVETVTRLGSFKLAAEELLITPSAVSHRIRLLEQRLGRVLFERIGQGVQPTAQAKRLANVVSRAQRDFSEAWQEIQDEAQAGPIRVSCLAAFAGNFILPDMEEFRTRFPQFELELTSSLFTGSPRELHADVLISSGPAPGPDWSTNDLMPMDMLAIMAPGLTAPPVRDGKLFGPLLSYTTGDITWGAIADQLGLQLQPGASIITLDSVEAACTAAERGLGLALAPVSTVRRLVRSGQVITIGTPIVTGRSYWIAVRRERRDTPAVRAFQLWVGERVRADDVRP